MKDIDSLVMLVRDKDDCNKLEDTDIRHVNIDIKDINVDVIKYLLNSNNKYLVSDYIDDKYGYVYVTLDKYKEGQGIINNILSLIMDKDYDELEVARYLYIKLGKIVNIDINAISSKSDLYNFNTISNINNIWESISIGKVNNMSLCKLYLYLCSMMDLDCEIVSNNDSGYLVNKINIDGKSIFVDITRDLYLIQGGFKTKYFDNYNDDIELDKKIGYVNNDYSDMLIDTIMKKIDYSLDNFLYNILVVTSSFIDINNIGTYELYTLYKEIFDKYCGNYDIRVSNMYIRELDERSHFVVISYNNKYYSYNYDRGCFVEVDNLDLVNNINNNNIGVYLDEDIVINGYEVLEEV